MDSIMYTKEGEFEVTLRGGSPWGFMIRTQSGNGYNRGRVIVAKVVQGGKADSSGNIHVGDEILAVNGLQFDNEQQATEYVRVAKKELILKVKRGQDKRRMNIRLAGELPNYFTTALESPLEKNLYEKQTNMLTNNDNNKRSSKEYEKDIKYGVDSNIANALIDYQSGEQGHSATELNRRSLRLTRSTTDLSESSRVFGEKTMQDDISRERRSSYMYTQREERPRLQRQYTWSGRGERRSSSYMYTQREERPRLQRQYTWSGRGSPPWKSYNTPPSPDKVQRVRIRSTNVTSPGHYKCSPEGDQDNQKRSDSRSSTPGCSQNVQKPFSMTEDLNRTWPSVASPDISRQDIHLSHKGFSVSATRSQFEQLSRASLSENDFAEKPGRSRSSSSSLAAPKPPSRNSSFRSVSSRRTSSSSSSVFSENGNTKSSEKKEASPSIAKPDSVFEKSRTLGSDKDFNAAAPLHRGSSSDDLDKPKPPLRFSRSKVLTSFRSGKKPVFPPTPPSGQSIVHDRKKELLKGLSENTYHHDRSQSLPSSKVVSMHLTSKSWVADREHKSLDLSSEDYSPAQRLPRSSSFSRARVLETSSIKTVHRDDARFPTYASKNSSQNSRQGGAPVIQALRTGEVSSERTHQLDTKLRSISTPFLQQVRNNKRLETKGEQSVPVLKENSIMQRLLMESQGQGEPATRSKAAAIKQEITQRSSYTTSSTKQTVTIKTEKELPLQQQRPVDQSHNNETEANLKLEARDKTQGTSKMPSKNENETAVDDLNEIQTDVQNVKNVTEPSSKVDHYLDKLLVKLDSPPVKRPSPPVDVPKITESPDLSDDECFPDPPKEVLENETNFVENESQVENDVMSLEITAENPTSDLVISKNERNFEIVTPVPEIVVQADQLVEIFESSPPVFVKDDNDNISESVVSEKMYHEMDDKINQSIELKDYSSQQCQILPLCDASIRIMHSRENSASSLLEETLESAKTIASIYSVEGPTRSADGEDSISTASEMRRYSLAKRVVRKRPKPEHEVPSTKKTETAGELDQSFVTPERSPLSEPSSSADGHEMSVVDESGNQSAGSLSSSGSRPGSDNMSPKLEVLEEQKEVLISSMKKKVELLKEQESEISEEMKQNDELGKRMASDVKAKISATAISKFELFVSELNNIIGLLLSLTQRMHRYEVMLQDIDLAEDNGREKRDVLLKQIDRVKQQYEEACTIKEINDKRGENVAKFVEESCSDEEFADFQHFVDMKTQLALTQAEIRDKIKLGEEKLNALTSAQIDWSSFDLSSR